MASKRATRRRSCDGKVRHVSYSDAVCASRALMRVDKWQPDMQIYRCKFCGGYHIGHMTTRQLQARRARMIYERR